MKNKKLKSNLLINLEPNSNKIELPYAIKVIDNNSISKAINTNNFLMTSTSKNSKNEKELFYHRKIRVQSSRKNYNPKYYTPKSMLDVDISEYINNRNLKSGKNDINYNYLKTEISNFELASTKYDEAYLKTAFSINTNSENTDNAYNILNTNTQEGKYFGNGEENNSPSSVNKKQFSSVSMNRIIEKIKLKEELKIDQLKEEEKIMRKKESQLQYRGLLQCQEFDSNLNKKNSELIDNLQDERSSLIYNNLVNTKTNNSPKHKHLETTNKIINSDKITSITDKNTKNTFRVQHVSKMVKNDNPLKDYVVKLEEKRNKTIKKKAKDRLEKENALKTINSEDERKSTIKTSNLNKSSKSHPSNTRSSISRGRSSSNRSRNKVKNEYDDDSQYFEYNLEDQKIEYFPQEVRNILKHQYEVFQGLFRNKAEFYDYINACDVKSNNNKNDSKLGGIFSQTEVNKIYKINYKDSKKAMQNNEPTKKEKILNIFRNGIESYEINPDPFLQRKHFFLAKNPLPTIRSVRGKEEPSKGKINYLNEMFLKTANWIKSQYLPISSKMSKINKQHIFALGRENGVRFGEEFQVADRKKFDERFRSCPNIIIDDKNKELNRLLTQLTNKNKELDNEVNNQVNSETNNIKTNEYKKKQDKWIRCVISAAIHFKRLNCSIHEFFSENFKISKPYSKLGSWNFFQAVKNNDEELIFTLLYENKFLVHDFDYHKQTALHWAAKRNFSNLIPILIKYGAKVDFQDSSGRTPLHYASLHNHMESVIMLLKEQADPLVFDDLGKTPSQLTTSESINYYLKRIKALYIIYSNASKKEAEEKIKRGIDYVFQHESLRIQKEKIAKKKKQQELGN